MATITTSFHTVGGQIRGQTASAVFPSIVNLTDSIGNVTQTIWVPVEVSNGRTRYGGYGAKPFVANAFLGIVSAFIGAFGYRRTGRLYVDSYLRARHYSTSSARFSSAVRLDKSLGGESSYGYARCNPLRFSDGSGLDPAPGAMFPNCSVGTVPIKWPKGTESPRIGVPRYGTYRSCILDAINKECPETMKKVFGSAPNAIFAYVMCIIDGESSWNRNDRIATNNPDNPGYAVGLMQITGADLPGCIKNGYGSALTDPCANIGCGVRQLCNKLYKKGNIFSMAAWHAFNSVGLTPTQVTQVPRLSQKERDEQVKTRFRFLKCLSTYGISGPAS